MKDEPILDGILQRLAGMERQLRWWKILGSTTITVLGLIIGLGATTGKPAQEIRAQRFVLVHETGKIQGELTEHDGGPSLRLYDAKGNERVELNLDKYGFPALRLRGLSPESDILLMAYSLGPFLSLSFGEGKQQIWLGVMSSGNSFSMSDKDGHNRVALSLTDVGALSSTSLTLSAASASPAHPLDLRGKTAEEIQRVMAKALQASRESRRIELEVTNGEPSLALYAQPQGGPKVKWKVP